MGMSDIKIWLVNMYSYLGVVKRIIPAVASTNAVIAGTVYSQLYK